MIEDVRHVFEVPTDACVGRIIDNERRRVRHDILSWFFRRSMASFFICVIFWNSLGHKLLKLFSSISSNIIMIAKMSVTPYPSCFAKCASRMMAFGLKVPITSNIIAWIDYGCSSSIFLISVAHIVPHDITMKAHCVIAPLILPWTEFCIMQSIWLYLSISCQLQSVVKRIASLKFLLFSGPKNPAHIRS